MIHVAIYGSGKWSRLLKTVLEGGYSDLWERAGEERFVADFYVTKHPAKEDEITPAGFAEKYNLGELAAIIIPKEYFIEYNEVVLELLRLGVDTDDIYNGVRLFEGIEEKQEFWPYLITPMMEDSYLSYLEYHVTDHCNLNCKYCTHYAPLVTKPVFTDPDLFRQDLRQLRTYVEDIGVIRILGGEPLLSPDLPKFIRMTREIYPGSIITVVSNGLLIEKASEELLETMRDEKAFFFLSYYPPLEQKLCSIRAFLVEKKVPFSISEPVRTFRKTQTLTPGDPGFFYECFQATCTCLHDGQIAPCYAPFTTKYFNGCFDEKIPECGGINLYEEGLSLMELKMRLLLPMERCSYCKSGEEYPWEVVGTCSKKSDWI